MDTNQPENKKAPLLLFSKWFASAFVSALGLHWGLLKIADFYKSIFKEDSVSTWIYVVLVQVVIAGLVSAIRLAVYYHNIYRMYRSQALVDNLYLDRTVLQGKYEKLVDETEKEFFVCGISLHTMLQDSEVRALMVRKVRQGVRFRLLLHHPESPYIRQRALEEGKHVDSIAHDCETHLRHCSEIAAELTKNGVPLGQFLVRTVNNQMPTCFLLKRDRNSPTTGLSEDLLYIEPYLTGFTGRDCPLFALRRNDENVQVFDKLTLIMEQIWERADPVSFMTSKNAVGSI